MSIVYESPWFNCHGYRAKKVKFSNGRSRTIFEHRELMSRALGRRLKSSEVVHHKNGDRRDNRLSNLELLSAEEHTTLHHPAPEYVDAKCPECGVAFQARARYVRNNQGRVGGAGPFCGRHCAGRFNQRKRAPTSDEQQRRMTDARVVER